MRRINQLGLAALPAFGLGWLAASVSVPLAAEPAKHAGPPAFPMTARLGANIWQQASAEYAACCTTIFNAAAQRLEELVNEKGKHMQKPAVVMDLDETVLDNGAFQTFLYRNNLEYTEDLWLQYEENHPEDVRLVPGAEKYISLADRLQVKVVFVSNRSERFRESTHKALSRLLPFLYGPLIPNHPPRTPPPLYLKTTTSDKAARREAIAATYTVLQVFGDNLRDFSESFAVLETPADLAQAITDRKQRAEKAGHRWGVDWYMLPNAVYGEWDKLIGPDPLALLHPTGMRCGAVSSLPP